MPRSPDSKLFETSFDKDPEVVKLQGRAGARKAAEEQEKLLADLIREKRRDGGIVMPPREPGFKPIPLAKRLRQRELPPQ